MRVVSTASARVIAGRMVVSRRASIDLPALGGPKIQHVVDTCQHRLSLYFLNPELMEVVWQVRARGITESACEGAKDVMRLDYALGRVRAI